MARDATRAIGLRRVEIGAKVVNTFAALVHAHPFACGVLINVGGYRKNYTFEKIGFHIQEDRIFRELN
jgi:hypothetical protein